MSGNGKPFRVLLPPPILHAQKSSCAPRSRRAQARRRSTAIRSKSRMMTGRVGTSLGLEGSTEEKWEAMRHGEGDANFLGASGSRNPSVGEPENAKLSHDHRGRRRRCAPSFDAVAQRSGARSRRNERESRRPLRRRQNAYRGRRAAYSGARAAAWREPKL